MNLARPHVQRAGADHLRGHGVRGGSHADQPDRRRRDHLGQGGRGLPALRRGGHRRRGLHDPDRREAERRRSPSSPTSGSTTSARWTACGRGSTTCSRRPKNKGEYFLTDAFQWMIEHGKRILTAEVGGWYDCGTLGTLLETNETLLRKGAARRRGLSRRHDPRSGVHRGRRHRRAERDRAQRLARARHQGERQPAAQHHRRPGRGPHRRARSTARCSAISVVVEGFTGSAYTGRSFRGDGERLMEPRDSARGSMASVDDLCRSYLDLKYHFDPAAASAAGLVSHDAPARPVRRGQRCARTWPRSGRSRARSRSWRSTTCRREIDRTALLGEIRNTIFRLEHEQPHVRNPGFWLGHLFQGLYAVLARRNGAAGGPRARGARAAPSRPRVPRRGARHARRAALGVRGHRARHAGRRRRAGGPARRPRSARSRRSSGTISRRRRVRRSRRSSASAPRSATRSSPTADPHAFAIGEEQFSRRLHHEHALVAGAPELWRYGLHLQEETETELVAAGGGAGRAAMARAGGGAAERRTATWTQLLPRLPRGAGPGPCRSWPSGIW